jgi:outer membrane autotransporter protein
MPVGNTIVITLLTASGSLPTTGLTGNELITADYLNNLPTDLLNEVALIMGGLSGSALRDALQTISPSRLSFATYASQLGAISVNGILSNRMGARRMIPSYNALCCEMDSQRPECCCVPTRDYAYTAWIEEFGNWSHQDAQEQNPAFRAFTGGTILGFDLGNARDASAGVVVGFVSSSIHDATSFGSQDVNNYLWGAYASVDAQEIFFEGALWTGYNRVFTRRDISFTDYYQTSKSEFNAWQLSPHFKLGMDIDVDSYLTLQPFVAVDWPIFFQEKYQEHGAGIFSMKIKNRTSSFCQVLVGCQALEVWDFGCFTITMQESLEYIHRVPFRTGHVNATIIGAPTSFTTVSFTEDQNLIGGSLDFVLKTQWNNFVNLNVSGEGGSGYAAFEAFGGVGFEF